MDLHISSARPEDFDQIVDILTETFINDGVIAQIIRGNDNRRERLQEFYRAIVPSTLKAETIDVARKEAGGEILGLAKWESPKNTLTGMSHLISELPRLTKAIQVRHLPGTLKTLNAFSKYSPSYPHWTLDHIAVGPNARGLGVGSALIEYRLKLIDELQLPAYLESTTEASKRLYSRYGFGAIGTIKLGSGVTAFPMVRPITDQ